MMRRAVLIGVSVLLLAFPLTVWADNIPAKVFENGANDVPMPQAGVKVEVFGGFGFKALLSAGETGEDGGTVLKNVPLGKDVLVKLTKAGYIAQYDVRSYSDEDAEGGAVFWIGSEGNVKGLYSNLGETFDSKKGHLYLDISDELTEEGIEGIQLGASSGNVFDLGRGEYLIANADGKSVNIAIGKPGYAFDIESVSIPLFAGGMTQYCVKVQSGGGIYASGVTQSETSGAITGLIKRASDAQPVSGLPVAFTAVKTGAPYPSVVTNSEGIYFQGGFPVKTKIKVEPERSFWTIKPKLVTTKAGKTKTVNFKAKLPK